MMVWPLRASRIARQRVIPGEPKAREGDPSSSFKMMDALPDTFRVAGDDTVFLDVRINSRRFLDTAVNSSPAARRQD